MAAFVHDIRANEDQKNVLKQVRITYGSILKSEQKATSSLKNDISAFEQSVCKKEKMFLEEGTIMNAKRKRFATENEMLNVEMARHQQKYDEMLLESQKFSAERKQIAEIRGEADAKMKKSEAKEAELKSLQSGLEK